MNHQILAMGTHPQERSTPTRRPDLPVRLCNGVDAVFKYVCGAIVMATMVVLLALLGANVVARYALHEGGIAWISEMPGHLFPWMIAAGIVLATQRGSHIAVDFAFSVLPPRGARVLAVGIQLLVAVSYAVLSAVIWEVAGIAAAERTPLLGIANSWGYYALLFAACGTTLCSLAVAVRVALLGTAALPQGDPMEAPL